MQKFVLITALLIVITNTNAQQLSQVTFSYNCDFKWFALSTNQNILIRISDNGQILEAGTEEQSLYQRNYYARKLLPYIGRMDYYGQEADVAFRGKIKNVGTCFFTYYPSNDYPERAGKIKTAGNLQFDYYRSFEDAMFAGKIKNIGSNNIAYYSSFENDAFKGKPKQVGATPITYYSTFDDMIVKGKLKTVGAYRYSWYGSADRREFAGALKSGSQRQLVNGIIYIMQ